MRLVTRIRMALIGCAGLALSAGAQAQSSVSHLYSNLSGPLPDGMTMFFSVDVSDGYSAATKYLKTVKSGSGDTSGPLSVYAADSPEAVRAVSSTSEDFVGTWTYTVNPPAYEETWTIALSGSAGYTAIANLQEAVVLVGAGTQSAPYEIADYDDLLAFADIVRGEHETIARNVGAWAVLTADIDASGGWQPIGGKDVAAADAYTGTFDGRGHVIRHLSVDKTDLNCVGLFGTVGTVGVVRNVGLEDGSIKSTPTKDIYSFWIGGVVGRNYGTVENCHNAGSVSGSSYVGGVVGYNEGTVRNCYNAGGVHSYCDGAGGVVGRNYGTVENCHNTGAVIGGTEVDSEESGFFGFGGVVGSNVGGAVRNCYNTGDVTGDSRVGGVVGDNQGTVSNCYNAGDVSGEDEVGGVAGYNSSSGPVSNACYNTAVATSVPSPIGGGTTSGANVTNVKGLPEEDMQGANALRNIGLPEDVWVATPGYPLLKGFDVPYLDPVGGTNAVCAVAIPYFGQDTLTSGWYVVSGAVTNTVRIEVSGDVNLILKNGAELVAQQGINVSVIGNVTNRLAIWAQSTNESTRGSLTATGGKWQAGIGGNDDCGGGTVIVNGGRVTAFGGRYGSGIGGGDDGDGGNVTVNGGRVTAIAESHGVDESGAGIGGGSGGAGGYVTINGGDVTATGYSGAGIGGGYRNDGGMVTIRGGTVTANSSNGGAGIGGGILGGGGDVVISGGTIAASSILGQAIGRGEMGENSGDLSFNGMKGFASQDDMDAIPDRPVAENLRKSTCQSEWVALSVCDPHDYDGDSCRWCGAENPLKPIAASVTGWTGAYDGQGHGVDVAVTDPSDESPALRFTLDDPSDPDTVWSESAPMFTNVCDETVWVELSAEGYRTATISAAVTIARAPLAITAKDQTYVYNGRPQGEGDPVYVDPADIAAKVDVAGLAPGDALAGIVLSGHQTDPGVYTNWIAPSDALVTNAMGDATSNYDIGYTNGTLTIEEPPPPTVSNVRARQRWPWNGLVDVDYEVGGYAEGLEARIVFQEQGGAGRSWVASNFLAGAKPSAEPGEHRATWDARADGAADVVAAEVVATVSLVSIATDPIIIPDPDVWLLPPGYVLLNGDIYDNQGDKLRSADYIDTDLIIAPGDSCTCLLISSYENANGDTRYRQIEATPSVSVESDEKDMFSTTASAGQATVSVNRNTLIGSSAAISCSVAGCQMKNSLTFATAAMRGIRLYLPESGRPQRYDENAWDVYARVVPFADNSREVEAGATYQKATLSNDRLDELLVQGFSYIQNGNTFVQNMYKLEASVPESAAKVLVLFELRAKNAADGDWGFVMPAYMIDLSKSLYEEDRNYTENDYVPYDADYFFPLWTAEFNTNQTPFGTYKGNAKTKAFKVGDGVGFHTGRMTGSEGSGQGLWTINVSHVRPLDAAVIEGGLDDGNMKAAGTGETCLLGSWYGVEGIVYPIEFEELSTNPSTYSAEPTLLTVTQ